MANLLDDVIDAIRRIWCDIRRFIHRVVWHLPERGWRWLPNHPTWKAYMPSEGGGNRPYTCAEYVESRIRSQRPRWGPNSGEATTDNIRDRLTALGWVASETCRCGCCAGECRDCAVLYVDDQGVVAHVAIFDKVRCDWGGKLGNQLPIARFHDPDDYNDGLDTPLRLEFWCPRTDGGAQAPTIPNPQLTDAELHRRAVAGP